MHQGKPRITTNKLNICLNNEHVGEIEWLNCTVKEQVRGIYNTLTFNKLPGRMIVKLIAIVIFWLNALPPLPSVGGNLSPRQIITGLTINYMKHCRLQFGKYAQVHESHDNTIQELTTGVISLRPTGNSQRGFFFMSLTTVRRLNRQIFNTLLIPQDVINDVHCLARHNTKVLDIRDRDWRPFLNPEDGANKYYGDSTYAPSDDNSSDNKDESDNNQSEHDNNANLHSPPDQ